MQPMFHESHKRDITPDEWVANVRPDQHVEQEDQWAVLRHEVEKEAVQWPGERMRSGWETDDQRDTAEDHAFSSHAPFNDLAQAQHHVDIAVVGVGGGGMNAINRMMSAGVRGVRYIAMNTDAQVLALTPTADRICLGQHYTKGLGAGGNAATGMRAATESAAEIRAALGEADMVFIAAGMGGGTGTGAAPVVASIAKKLGALTIGIITLPFTFEGSRRRRVAEQGLHELTNEIDALITVPNDRLLQTVAREYSLSDAFKIADDVLRQGVQGIAEVINVPGMINVDFADVRSVLREAGTALMSIGQGQGRNRAQRAAEEAVAGGFLNVTIRGAKRVLFNISGGEDMTLFEVNEVAERIGDAIDSTADITFGAVVDPTLHDTIRVTLIAAGMDEAATVRLQAVRPDQLPSRPTPTNAPAPSPYKAPPSAPVTPMPPRTLPRSTGNSSPVPPSAPVTPMPSRTLPRGTGNPRPVPPDAQPSTQLPPSRSSGTVGNTTPPAPNGPARQQRSLNDLRGIRSLGRRQERQPPGKGSQNAGEGDDAIDVPSFMKKRYE